MSSTILKIISTAPSFEPDSNTQVNAKIFLAKFYKSDQIKLINTNEIQFIDQGQNFESVSCNLCGQKIEIEDWQNTMDSANEHQFTDLIFCTPCCKRETSLNDLNYKWPAGFAKFTVCISDAQNELSKSEQIELQHILGTTLRIIWAHY